MLQVLPFLAAIAYAIAALLLSRRLRGIGRGRNAALALAGLAVLLHAIYHGVLFARGGPDVHLFASLSLVALAMAAVTTGVSLWRAIETIGIVVFPIATLSVLAAAGHRHEAHVAPMDWQILLHVVLALLAFSVLAIAALVAVMLWVQERALRTHRVATVMRGFPALTLVEGLLFHLVAAGFVLLTLTVLTGVLFIENWFAQHLVHKTVLTLAAWVVFGALLLGHWWWGWRGRRAVRWTLAGMLLLLLGFLGSKFVLEIVLQRTN